MEEFNLKTDRADVIVPAAEIFLIIAGIVKAEYIHVPVIGLADVLDTFSNHSTTIINYFEERLTNASAESFNAKIKAFRSQLRGVDDLKFFMFRLARLYA